MDFPNFVESQRKRVTRPKYELWTLRKKIDSSTPKNI